MTVISFRRDSAGADTDLALVQAIGRGDKSALARLYERHAAGVFAYLAGQVGDRELAEEVLQDVMLAAWHGASAFRGESTVRTWLLTIAHNRAVNATRRKVLPLVPADPSIVERRGHAQASPDDADERLDLGAALAALSAGQRAVVDLVLVQGLTMVEAAAVLGVAPGTVKSRLHRAREAACARLAPERVRHV